MPKRGFTDAVKMVLLPWTDKGWEDRADDFRCFGDVPREVMLQVAKLLPLENLRDRQNGSPTFEAMLRLPAVSYSGYIVGARRSDERVTIDTVYVPKKELRKALKQVRASGVEPKAVSYLDDGLVELWWD